MTSIGHIYKIICITEPTFCYIGSTFNRLSKRFERHRLSYTGWLKDKNRKKCSCYPYYKKYGIENFKIVLIKSYEVCREHVKDRRHLEAYETLWINRHRGKCCNKNSPVEYLKKEKDSEYYYNNKEQKCKYQKEYAEKNKKHIDEYQKEYRKENRSRLNRQRKEYVEKNKVQITAKNVEKVQCECGCVVQRGSLTNHRKSKKHIQLMASK